MPPTRILISTNITFLNHILFLLSSQMCDHALHAGIRKYLQFAPIGLSLKIEISLFSVALHDQIKSRFCSYCGTMLLSESSATVQIKKTRKSKRKRKRTIAANRCINQIVSHDLPHDLMFYVSNESTGHHLSHLPSPHAS